MLRLQGWQPFAPAIGELWDRATRPTADAAFHVSALAALRAVHAGGADEAHAPLDAAAAPRVGAAARGELLRLLEALRPPPLGKAASKAVPPPPAAPPPTDERALALLGLVTGAMAATGGGAHAAWRGALLTDVQILLAACTALASPVARVGAAAARLLVLTLPDETLPNDASASAVLPPALGRQLCVAFAALEQQTAAQVKGARTRCYLPRPALAAPLVHTLTRPGGPAAARSLAPLHTLTRLAAAAAPLHHNAPSASRSTRTAPPPNRPLPAALHRPRPNVAPQMRLLDALPPRLELAALLNLLAASPALHGHTPPLPLEALTLASVATAYLAPHPPRGCGAAATRSLLLLQSRLVRCATRRSLADFDGGKQVAAAACKELQPLCAQHLDAAVATAVGVAAGCFGS